MTDIELPDEGTEQWDMLVLLIASREKKRISWEKYGELGTMWYFIKHRLIRRILLQWLQQMQLAYARKVNDSDTALKCDDVSVLWRQQGNEKFRANLFEDSYGCYTRSVQYAHQGGPMYPLALANRSAALLKLKRFEECMSDINLAIAAGYPLETQHKLLLRRADCHVELGCISEAKETIALATQHASTLSLTPAQSNEFERNIKILQQKVEGMADEPKGDDDVIPECYQGMNEDFNAASNALELRRSDAAGRHVVAKEATRRGDVMFSEEPYAWVALPHEETVCEGCCSGQINPIPCEECSRSAYCSVECRERAASYHRWECAGARADLFPTIGIAHLALRVLLVGANEGFPQVPEGEPTPTTAEQLFSSYACVDDIEIYQRDMPPFYRMFNLVTNFDKMNNTDYIQYALTATMLIIYLERFTTFFEYLPSRLPYALSMSQMRLFTGALILRSLGQLVCNGHATLSLCTVEEAGITRTLTEREVRRATAIYPSAAMMNHSCDPNIINTFYKTRLIVRCSREVAAGGELLNCYGPHRAREPTQHRRAQLRAQYMFTCNCAACTDTDRGDFVLLFTAYACQSCKGPVLRTGRKAHCQQCQADFHLQKALAAIDTADELFAQAERASCAEERCEKAHASFRMKQQVWHRHHTSLRAAADKLARLYAEAGEFSKSVELIKQNIQSLEYQFGSFSVEVAHELRKLSDVMLARIIRCPQNPDYREWCLETHKIMKKAVQLMELNYGSWEVLVKRLREQEAFVASLVAGSRAREGAADTVHRDLHYNLKI